jgi:thiol-disulfide isomerase/thioredoxin
MSQLDLTKATIQTTLSALPADDSVLIEFFASWCPACRWGQTLLCEPYDCNAGSCSCFQQLLFGG